MSQAERHPIASRLKRRRLQFSLGTLMLFVTASSIACSWLAVKMQQAKRPHEAAWAIEKLGGQVKYDHQPLVPAGLRKLFGDDMFDSIVSVQTWRDEALKPIFRKCGPRFLLISFQVCRRIEGTVKP